MKLDLEDIKQWYLLNGCPNRDKIREGGIKLPSGVSQSLIESLIPYFNQEQKSSNIYIPSISDKIEKNIVVTSDWHIPYYDVEALKVFFNFLKDYQPDELVLNGNLNDCTAFSTHPKIREVAQVFRTAKQEREIWLPIAEYIRDILPNAKITYIGSQCHEGWIDKWTSLSPILVEDENYTIKNWFKLDDFGIDFEPEQYDILGDKTLLISHGTIVRGKGGASAQAEIEMSGTNVIMGHTHKLSQVYKTNAVEELVGFECGCFCIRKPWYIIKGRRRMMDWQQGFVLINSKDNSFGGNCIPVIRDGLDRPYFWVGKERYK